MGVAVIPSKVNSASPDTWPGKSLTRKLSWSFAPFLTMFVWFWVVAHWFPLREGRDMMNIFFASATCSRSNRSFPF